MVYRSVSGRLKEKDMRTKSEVRGIKVELSQN